jgi:hypothetical protein
MKGLDVDKLGLQMSKGGSFAGWGGNANLTVGHETGEVKKNLRKNHGAVPCSFLYFRASSSSARAENDPVESFSVTCAMCQTQSGVAWKGWPLPSTATWIWRTKPVEPFVAQIRQQVHWQRFTEPLEQNLEQGPSR